MKSAFAFSLLAIAMTTITTASPSFAQQPAAPPAPAALPISEEAKQHFTAGVSLLQDPEGEKVEEAYRQFKTAYDLSSSAKILGNMGFCAMRLERDGEAIDAYSRYLREVPDIDPEERAQIVRDLQTLTVGVARISIEANVPGVMIIDQRIPIRGSQVTNSYGPISKNKLEVGIRPGHHIITAKVAGREDAQWELEAYAGSKEQHAFVLKEPVVPVGPVAPREEKPSYLGPILVLSAGGVMLIAGSITGVVALGKTSDIQDQCPNDLCPRNYDLSGERSSARTFVGVTDVLLGLGTLAVLGGLYWTYRVSSSTPKSAGSIPKPLVIGGDWRLGL